MSLLPRRRSAGTAAAVLVALTLATAAQAAAAAPPTPQDVAAQRAEADRLQDDLESAERVGDQAQARLDELSAAAGTALEGYQQAEKARFEAEAEHWIQSERLDAAQQSLRASRGELGRWAAQTYRDGPAGGAWGLDAVLDARSSDDLGQRMAMLEVLARTQGDAVESLQEAAGTQASVTADAETTARDVMDATLRATAARTESERLVADQREQLAVIEAALSRTRQSADTADQAADRLAAARALADQQAAEAEQREAAEREAARRQASLTGPSQPGAAQAGTWQLGAPGGGSSRPAAGAARQVAGPTGACLGQDVSWFANGQIPAAALCPLWGARGHLLRADAAYAFDQLATAWAAEHGTPLCVTDSYRSFDSQVRLFATKPNLAARPGTSNHGWGVAVDLCGGIQSFGTAEHRWMRQNAPLFGWFRPGWAQQGGSRPEPWHWEFGG